MRGEAEPGGVGSVGTAHAARGASHTRNPEQTGVTGRRTQAAPRCCEPDGDHTAAPTPSIKKDDDVSPHAARTGPRQRSAPASHARPRKHSVAATPVVAAATPVDTAALAVAVVLACKVPDALALVD